MCRTANQERGLYSRAAFIQDFTVLCGHGSCVQQWGHCISPCLSINPLLVVVYLHKPTLGLVYLYKPTFWVVYLYKPTFWGIGHFIVAIILYVSTDVNTVLWCAQLLHCRGHTLSIQWQAYWALCSIYEKKYVQCGIAYYVLILPI